MGCAVVILLVGMVLAGPLRTPVGPWGQVADISSTPEQAWSVNLVEDLYSARMAGGMLVTTGPQTVRGLDPTTGQEVWQVELTGARCTSDSTNLLCTDMTGRAVRIDPATGTTTDLDVTGAVAVAASGGDLFALTLGEQQPTTAGQEGQLQRISDGQVLWSTPVTIGRDVQLLREPMAVVAGHVLTMAVADWVEFGGVTGAVFDAETGEQLAAERPYVVQLGPGVWAVMDQESSALYVRGEKQPITSAGGSSQLQYDAQWRSDDVVTMDAEGVLTVRDRRSGELRWRSEQMTYPIARIDGVLFVLVPHGESATMQGLRADTGELLWQRDDHWLMCPCVSDRSTLAGQLRQLSPAGGFVGPGPVVGLDARSGEKLWQVEAPEDMFQIVTDGKHLVLVSPRQLTGWRIG